ncbi:unnamed protein product, partial [Oncorhynchus mykiss]
MSLFVRVRLFVRDDDDDGEWDEEWDDARSTGGYGETTGEEEGEATGRNTHTHMKISLNKFAFSKIPNPEVYLLAKLPPKGKDRLAIYTTNRPVNHRYKHFDWLYERLLEKFGSAIPIPSLPDKQVTGQWLPWQPSPQIFLNRSCGLKKRGFRKYVLSCILQAYSALRKYSAPLNFATFCHISGFKHKDIKLYFFVKNQKQ